MKVPSPRRGGSDSTPAEHKAAPDPVEPPRSGRRALGAGGLPVVPSCGPSEPRARRRGCRRSRTRVGGERRGHRPAPPEEAARPRGTKTPLPPAEWGLLGKSLLRCALRGTLPRYPFGKHSAVALIPLPSRTFSEEKTQPSSSITHTRHNQELS